MSEIKPNERYCPLYGTTHRFSDFTGWGHEHPTCDCGYEDITRILKNGKTFTLQGGLDEPNTSTD